MHASFRDQIIIAFNNSACDGGYLQLAQRPLSWGGKPKHLTTTDTNTHTCIPTNTY